MKTPEFNHWLQSYQLKLLPYINQGKIEKVTKMQSIYV